MVAAGKVTAEQAATLFKALEKAPAKERSKADRRDDDSLGATFDRIRDRLRMWRLIPLWMGVSMTVGAVFGFAAIQQGDAGAAWLLCLIPMFVFGAALSVVGSGAGRTRWLYLSVDRSRKPDGPRRVSFGLPLPLGATHWFLQRFGKRFKALRHTVTDEVIQALASVKKSDSPVIVDVDEEDGARVQIYLG